MNYSDLFDQEFLNLAGIEDRSIKGVLSYIELREIYEYNWIGNYLDPRWLEFQRTYIPFGCKSFFGSEKDAANEIIHDCLKWLEKLVLSVIEVKANGNDNKEISLPKSRYITDYQFGKPYESGLCEKVLELVYKSMGNKLLCVGAQDIIDKLQRDLNKFTGIDYFVISNGFMDNKAYILTKHNVVIGCRTKFMFFSKPDIYSPNTILCQAQGEFDAARSDEDLVLVVDVVR